MRRIFIVLLMLTLAGTPQVSVANVEVKPWRYEQCRFQGLRAAPWTPLEEKLTSLCALARWSVPGGYRKFYAVGDCESGWNRLASNGGMYLGLFQHSALYWEERVKRFTPKTWTLSASWRNSRTQIIITARMVNRGGWHPWSCA